MLEQRIQPEKINIPLTFSYSMIFLLLMRCIYLIHEFIHHLVGRITVGEWGTMTFDRFYLPAWVDYSTFPLAAWSTASAPLYNYVLMWIGVYFMIKAKEKYKRLGFSLIFANLPMARFVTILTRGGDEMVITRFLWGENGYFIMLITVIFLTLPVVIIAFRNMSSEKRILKFSLFLLLPLFIDRLFSMVVLRPLNSWISEPSYWGIPLVVILIDIVFITALIVFRKTLMKSP